MVQWRRGAVLDAPAVVGAAEDLDGVKDAFDVVAPVGPALVQQEQRGQFELVVRASTDNLVGDQMRGVTIAVGLPGDQEAADLVVAVQPLPRASKEASGVNSSNAWVATPRSMAARKSTSTA